MNAHGRAAPMHLKSCQIDGRLLRATESQECGPHLRQLRCGRERKLSQCEAGGRFEGVGKRGTAAFDAPDRRRRLQEWRRSTPDKVQASWRPAVHADGIRAELKNSASS